MPRSSSSRKSNSPAQGTPVADAAAAVLKSALTPFPRQLRRVAKLHGSAESGPEVVHQLRVSCRRARAALAAFDDLVDRQLARKLNRTLRKLRRGAGALRDLDVQAEILARDASKLPPDLRKAARALARDLADRREGLGDRLRAVVDKHSNDRWERLQSGLLKSIDASRVGERMVEHLARRVVRIAADDALAAASAGLETVERAHALRVALKRLRYRIELFRRCGDAATIKSILSMLEDLQDSLGKMNDLDQVAVVVEEAAREGRAGTPMSKLAAEYRRRRDLSHDEAVKAWNRFRSGDLFAGVEAAFTLRPTSETPAGDAQVVEAKPRSAAERTPRQSPGSLSANGSLRKARRRIAAIDVGTNSLRLIVAEAGPDSSYRVLDDEKEITRLGRGLHEHGRLDAVAIEHSTAAIARMKSIAEGYGVSEIRVVATAAAREASNRDVLLDAIRKKTGLQAEVISADQEAALAYRSAAGAFDLASQAAAVIDIGGGSTEVVLSVGRERGSSGVGSGVIERVYTIPLGAVRLTERFGGAEASGDAQFDRLGKYIKSVVRQHVGKAGPPITPQIVIGTGGTFTTLGAMAKARVRGGEPGGLFDGSVQGYEVTRADVRHLLDYLRKLPVRERARTPGLPADRADIIVAGLAIVDALLKALSVNRVRVHVGGIRDGLLLSMVEDGAAATASGAAPARDAAIRDPLRSVRRFARACAYEQPHACHVAELSVSLFDQLLPRVTEVMQAGDGKRGDNPDRFDAARARQLLEAAAILHDIGYLINYNSHHKHSLHLILHADLPGWTAPEIAVLANVARYHRGAEPKVKHAHFAALTEHDRKLVCVLSAILRIADGLDRTHTQRVRAVQVRISGRSAYFAAQADDEPGVDMWGGARKAELFERVFRLIPHFEWIRPGHGVASFAPGDGDGSAGRPETRRKLSAAAPKVRTK